MNLESAEVWSYKLLFIPFMSSLKMGMKRGWFESICIVAMCFTELSGSVNILW